MNTIVIGYRVFAMMRARKMVKDDFKRKGIKPSSYTCAEIEAMARMYFELHPDIIRVAREDVDRLTLEGAFGKRACSNKEISVQISSAK